MNYDHKSFIITGIPNASLLKAVLTVALITLALLLPGCSEGGFFSVNGEGVTLSEFEQEVDKRLTSVRDKNPEELEGTQGREFIDETKRDVATGMIKETIIAQQAGKLHLSAAPAEISELFEEERDKLGLKAFEKSLKEQGISEDEFKKQLEGQVLIDKIGKKISADVTVSTDEAESFYLTNKDLFSSAVMIHAAHILYDTEGDAVVGLEELKKGQNFTALAESASKDTKTRSNGGDLGWIERGTVDPAFEEAAFVLAAGQVSGVVQASDGFHIIKVLERREAYTAPFGEVKEKARSILSNRRKEEKFSDWLRTVYANAQVELPASLGKWNAQLGRVVAP